MVARSLPPLLAELSEGDELVVVDNGSGDGTAHAVRELAPGAKVIEAGANLGFGAGCNRGAAQASAELLCFLNPDAVVQPGFRKTIVAPLDGGADWAAWQGLVTAEGGTTINTSGGVVHFTGVAWAGQAGEPAAAPAPAGEPGFVSGACLAIRREAFADAGGFAEDFFLYHEDVDLSLRLRLAGGRLGVVREAWVDHEYEFEKGAAKWRHLERNRWATILRTYPPALLMLLGPALAATELALVFIAAAGGWLPQKLGSWLDVLRSLPRLAGERRRIQADRAIGSAPFALGLTPDLGSAYLGAAGRSGLLGGALAAYWRLVLRLLGAKPDTGA